MTELWQQGKIPYFNEKSTQIPHIDEYLIKSDSPLPSVIVFPGGGYEHLAPHEGKTIAEFYNAHGFNAFVVTSRLAPDYRHPAMLCDALRAIRLVRYNHEKYNVIPDRIAICGFSAGGHLVGSATTLYNYAFEPQDNIDKVSARPDAAIICYGVISMQEITHVGSRKNLLSGYSGEEYIALSHELSAEEHIDENTPPVFMWHTAADNCVKTENSLMMALALQKHKIPYELHIFPTGGHGLGLAESIPHTAKWSALSVDWLKDELHFCSK